MSTSRASLPYRSYASADPDSAAAVDTPMALQGGRVVMGGSMSGAPTLVSATPGDNSSLVAVGSNIVLTFSANIVAGSGSIVVSDGYQQSYIDKAGHVATRWVGVTDSHVLSLSDSQVTISGNTVTIDLANDLKPGVSYNVTMASGVLKDSFNRPYAGLLDSSKLNFTTDASTVAQISGALHFNDSGTSASDYLTNVAAQSMHGTYSGILAAGDKVQVSMDNGGHWFDATAASGSWSYDGSGFDPLTANGTMLARVIDSGNQVHNTVSHGYVFDHGKPSITGTTISAGNLGAGESATVTVTFSEAVVIQSVAASAGSSSYGDFHSSDGGLTWSATVTPNALTSAASVADTLHISATDLAGNALNNIDMADYAHVPVYSVNTVTLSNDSGSSAHDFYTNSVHQTISGSYASLPVDGSILVSLDGGSTFVNATANPADHTWSVNADLLDGTQTLMVKVQDGAAQVIATYSHSYTLDTQAPEHSAASLVVDLDDDSDTGATYLDNITNAAQPSVDVHIHSAYDLHSGDVVQIVDSNHGNAIVGSYTLVDNDLQAYGGDFTIQLDQPLDDGVHQLKVQIGDLAGNTPGAASDTPLYVTVDTVKPILESSLPANGELHVARASIQMTFNEDVDLRAMYSFTLTSASGDEQSLGVENQHVSIDGHTMTIVFQHALDANTDYTLTLDGPLTDLAGNAAEWANDQVLQFHTDSGGGGSAPGALSLSYVDTTSATNPGGEATDHVTSAATIEVSGLDNNAYWSYQIDGGGWNIGTGSSFTLPDRDHAYAPGDILVKQTNAYGSSADATVGITLDTSAPDAYVVPGSIAPLSAAGGAQTITGYASYTGSGNDFIVEVSFDHTLWTRATPGTPVDGIVGWSVDGVTNGTIDVRIGDAAGNIFYDGGFTTDIGVGTAGIDTYTVGPGTMQYGQGGNDRFNLGALNFSLVDGGADTDTLGFSLNHQDFVLASYAGRLKNVEVIDLGASQFNKISIGTGVALSQFVAASAGEYTLAIHGDANDVLNLTDASYLVHQDSNYTYYDSGHNHLIVDIAIPVPMMFTA
jgi:methionine-rich copper-binding protein CopC